MTKTRFIWAIGSLIALAATIFPSTMVAQKGTPSANVGVGVALLPSHIMFSELPAPVPTGKITVVPEPQTGRSEAEWKEIKAQAAVTPAVALPSENKIFGAPNRPVGETLSPGASLDVFGSNEDLACSELVPSDMGVAVSASYVVQVTNACVEVFNRNGALLTGYPKTLSSFFNQTGNFTYDPRILYDWQTGRFIATSATKLSDSGYVNVAVSETSNPTGGWYTYSLQFGSAGQWGDFPTVGQTDEGDNDNGLITICANIFTISNNSFVGNQCDFLNKFEMYQGHGFSFNYLNNLTIGGTLVDTLQPANLSNPYEKPRAQFLIDSYNIAFSCGSSSSGCNGLNVWAVSNAIPNSGSPGLVWSEINVSTPSSYTFPADADQPGDLNSVDTDDERITATVSYSGGFLYPVINVGNGGTSAALGWKVAVFLNDNGDGHCTGTYLNACPTLDSHTAVAQEFCYNCGAGHSNSGYYGSIGVTPEGNWTMTANYSDESTNPGTFITSNRVTWPTPFHDFGGFICQANNGYTQGRWGDYTGSAGDIEAKGTGTIFPAVWSSGMYVQSDGDWGTCIADSGYSQPTQP